MDSSMLNYINQQRNSISNARTRLGDSRFAKYADQALAVNKMYKKKTHKKTKTQRKAKTPGSESIRDLGKNDPDTNTSSMEQILLQAIREAGGGKGKIEVDPSEGNSRSTTGRFYHPFDGKLPSGSSLLNYRFEGRGAGNADPGAGGISGSSFGSFSGGGGGGTWHDNVSKLIKNNKRRAMKSESHSKKNKVSLKDAMSSFKR